MRLRAKTEPAAVSAVRCSPLDSVTLTCAVPVCDEHCIVSDFGSSLVLRTGGAEQLLSASKVPLSGCHAGMQHVAVDSQLFVCS